MCTSRQARQAAQPRHHLPHRSQQLRQGRGRNIEELRRCGQHISGPYQVFIPRFFHTRALPSLLFVSLRVGALNAHEHNPYDYEIISESFDKEYQKLLRGEAVFCSHTQKEVPALAPPQALILDVSTSEMTSVPATDYS